MSEFGRRLHQNASGGTDHGSASIALVLGDHLPAPLLGSYPSLANLDGRGDLIVSISPRRSARRSSTGKRSTPEPAGENTLGY